MIAISTAAEWLIVYLMSLQLAVNSHYSNQIKIERQTIPTQNSIFNSIQEPGLAIYCLQKDNNDTLISWYLLPYQSFSIEQEWLATYELLTVTEHAIIYEKNEKFTPLTGKIREKFHQIIALKHYEKNENTIPLSLIGDSCSAQYKKQYCKLEIFNNIKKTNNFGNDLVEHELPMECTIYFNTKKNPILHNWKKKSDNKRMQDRCWKNQENQYTQTIKNHISYWLQKEIYDGKVATDSLMMALKEIMYQCAQSMSRHENYFDFFVSNIFLTEKNRPMMYEMFPDYTPKTTPDKVLDFRPALSEQLEKFPKPELQNLPELINLFQSLEKQAKQNPGKWVDGNIILGANPKEYLPSDQELLLSELGNSIQNLILKEKADAIKKLLKQHKIKIKKLQYNYYTYLHADVMGSGRFFYIDNVEQKQILLP